MIEATRKISKRWAKFYDNRAYPTQVFGANVPWYIAILPSLKIPDDRLANVNSDCCSDVAFDKAFDV